MKIMKKVRNIAIWEFFEGDNIGGGDNSGELKRGGLSPSEGLASGESEG